MALTIKTHGNNELTFLFLSSNCGTPLSVRGSTIGLKLARLLYIQKHHFKKLAFWSEST